MKLFDELSQSTYPGIPDWLIEQCDKLAQDKSINTHDNFNLDQLKQLLDNFTNAENDSDMAHQIASNYEMGNIAGGVNLKESELWYRHAAEIGSSHSAVRLFYLKDEANYLILALKNAISEINLKRSAVLNIDDPLKLALQVSIKLLALKPSDQTILPEIERILNHRHFKNAPNYEKECLIKQYQLFLAGCNKVKNHQIVKEVLIDDGDFKVGIYKNLNLKLPLVLVGTNIDMIKNTLDNEFPWFKAANFEIYKQLKARLMNGVTEFKIRPLLLAGPPGTGKTTWAKRLGELCNVSFSMVMAGGSSDSMHLKGLARGWGSSRPSAVAKFIAVEKIANPLFLIDELDKVSSGNHNGSLYDVLLQLIEPATNSSYMDECLQASCDFSWVSWIATCNTLGTITKPLLDRFTIIYIDKPDVAYAPIIIESAIKRFANDLQIDSRLLPVINIEENEILKRLSPREINKVVRMMLENKLIEKAYFTKH